VTINGKPAIRADVITITFKKDTFNRVSSSLIDPPEQLIRELLDSFVERLRFVAEAPQVKSVNFPNAAWRLQYLNDDSTELEPEADLVRGRGNIKFTFNFLGCTPEVWDSVFLLPSDFEAPSWHTLLLDSQAALPHIGTAVVLGATALEIFIAQLLDKLAKESTLSATLWTWVTHRGNWLKDPSVEEQFDNLLSELSGHSLKEKPLLWEAFKNLKAARNSFVHEGVASIGGAAVSLKAATTLLGNASEITKTIREWIPENYRWPIFSHTLQVGFTKRILKDAPSQSG
jgi:hypothetical protein